MAGQNQEKRRMLTVKTRPYDPLYIRLEKDNVKPTVLLLRPDEAQALAWVSSGVIWSHLMELMHAEKVGANLPY